MTNGTIDATESIKKFLEEKIPKVGEDNLTYIIGFLRTKSYEDRLKKYKETGEKITSEKLDDVPFILIRPMKHKQSIKDGEINRNLKVNIRIVIEEKIEDVGYEKIIKLGEEIIDNFTFYPAINGGFALDTGNISGYLDYELSIGDYWTYVIELDVNLPVKTPRLLETLEYI